MIEKTTLSDFYNNQLDLFLNPTEEKAMYIVYDSTEITYGSANDCDIDWCKDSNIPAYDIQRSGGCIVSAKGNITMADVRRNTADWYDKQLLCSFVDFLKLKGIEAEIKQNDILIDGFKVASAASKNLKPDFLWQYTGMQISINQDLEVIKHACKKEMKKEPRGLSEWGITTSEVVNWLKHLYHRK